MVRRFGRRHLAAAFVAGVLASLGILAAVAWVVLADQRRAGRLLAAALTAALDREVRIARVTDLGPGRVVARGVELPRAGGWPADVSVAMVEATGALLAAARGEAAPVRLHVARPRVTSAPGERALDLAQLPAALGGLLASPALLEVTVTDGELAAADGEPALTFGLALRKGPGRARVEGTLGGRAGAPLTLVVELEADGPAVRAAVSGQGPLGALGAWLPAPVRALEPERLDLHVDVALGPTLPLLARGRLGLGSTTLAGAAELHEGALRLRGGHAELDLGLVAALAGLPWRPAGRAAIDDIGLAWRPGTGELAEAAGVLTVGALSLPPAALGTGVEIEGVQGRVGLDPAGETTAVRADLRIGRLRGAGLDAGGIEGPVRLVLGRDRALVRAEAGPLVAVALGVPLRGTVAWDGGQRRVAGRVEARAAELSRLVRALAPGWLPPEAGLAAGMLQVTVQGLDPVELSAGAIELAVGDAVLRRPDGELVAARVTLGARLEAGGGSVTGAVDGVRSAIAGLEGVLPRMTATARLQRAGGGFAVQRAGLVAHDVQGAAIATADVAMAGAGPPGPTRLAVRVPALERLGGLWPARERRIAGSAALDLVLVEGFGIAEGRLRATVPEAALPGSGLAVRGLSVDLPVRRGGAPASAPEPGRLEVAELVGYGLVAHDIGAAATLVDDRLGLRELRYTLYAGQGSGWADLAWGEDGAVARGHLRGQGVRVEEFMAAWGIRGGTMTGLLGFELDVGYRGGRLTADGRLGIPEGGTVTIDLLDRFLGYAGADPTGVARRAIENLRTFEYRSADASVRTAADDLRVSVSLRGRPRLGFLPPRVREINVRDMPLGFLARQFPGR